MSKSPAREIISRTRQKKERIRDVFLTGTRALSFEGRQTSAPEDDRMTVRTPAQEEKILLFLS